MDSFWTGAGIALVVFATLSGFALLLWAASTGVGGVDRPRERLNWWTYEERPAGTAGKSESE